jgi:branched-chain amino acid transport system permease protein
MKNAMKGTRYNLVTYGMVVAAYVIMQGMILAGRVSNSLTGQLIPICVYICMAVSLNLVVGILGDLSLGHAGFMSVGAFSGVVVSMSLTGLPPMVRLLAALAVGGIMAGIAGVLVGIPVLRLQGDYLAIVTLAFGEIIKNLLNNLYVGVDAKGLHFSMKDAQALRLKDGTVLINGPMGAPGIEKLSTFFMGFLLVLVVLFMLSVIMLVLL